MKNILKPLLTFLLAATLSSCATTAMYTSPSVLDARNHVYNFSIETGGYAGQAEADVRATNEIKQFMNENNYHHYKILNRSNLDMFSGFKYAVQFYN
ncbi:MAG: hypothetical protein JO149_00260 [Gammaproteobacteria bacterium]|nr:hypothetical protein [Gammaproteobacteria bacterium]